MSLWSWYFFSVTLSFLFYLVTFSSKEVKSEVAESKEINAEYYLAVFAASVLISIIPIWNIASMIGHFLDSKKDTEM